MKWKEWAEFSKNESFWEDHEEKGLLKAEYQRDYILRLWFEDDLDVSIYDLDFYPLLIEEDPGEALLPLRKEERFRYVEGDHALVWINPKTGIYDEDTIDISPECIRFFCEKYGKKVKSSQDAENYQHELEKQRELVAV